MAKPSTAAESRVLLSTQFLTPGAGGICTVARMTALALSQNHAMVALACQDKADHAVGTVPVRAFNDNRPLFFFNNVMEELRSARVIYDFAGTARAHLNIPLARRPYALWVHGWEIWQNSPEKYLESVARASLILSNSQYSIERAGKNIPSGLDVRVCELGTMQDAAPTSQPDQNAPPTVMLVGRVDDMFAKGHDILIDVWPQIVSAVPDARLIFVGGGNAIEKLRALAATSPVQAAIEIAGFVPPDAMDRYWRQTTVFALLGYAEGFGLVYIDAMRYGLPIIASTDDGGQQVNEDGVSGFNVARSDKKRLVEILVTLLRDRDYARSLGNAGHRIWRERYTFGAFGTRLRNATKTFLAGP